VLRALQEGSSQEREKVPGGISAGTFPSQPVEILWICGIGGMEVELLEREKVPFVAIPAAGVHGVGLRALPGNIWLILKGIISARSILRRFRPEVMLFTGGYLAIPVVLARHRKNPPEEYLIRTGYRTGSSIEGAGAAG
jgi:UDP-N-acetylglucosamine:LPS N-acetylglucosamine transferase